MEGHVESGVLTRFVAGELAPNEAPDVFGHLAHCEACRARVHALRAIAADPDAAWARWGAAAANGGDPAAAAGGRCWATLNIVIDAVRKVASVTVTALERTFDGDGLCLPAPASSGVGDTEAPYRVTAGEPRVEVALHGGRIGAVTVVADARREAVAVILEPPADEHARERLLARGPRAILADEQGLPRHTARFEPVAGATYLLAEFERPGCAHWILSLEFER